MPGYSPYQQPPNTVVIGTGLVLKRSNAPPILVPQSAGAQAVYPGNEYVNDPIQLTAAIGSSGSVTAADTQVLPLGSDILSESLATTSADQELGMLGSVTGGAAVTISTTTVTQSMLGSVTGAAALSTGSTIQVFSVVGTVTGSSALTTVSTDQLYELTATVAGNVSQVDAPFDPTINITGSFAPILLCATAAPPTQGFVQGNTYYGGSTNQTSQAISFTQNVKAGDLIVLAVGYSPQSNSISSVVSNQGSNWFDGGAAFSGAINYTCDVFWTIATTTGSFTATVTFTGTISFLRLMLHEYTGYSFFADGSFTSWGKSPGDTTPTNTLPLTCSHDLVFAWLVDNNGVTNFISPMSTRLTAGTEATGDCTDSGAPGTFTISANAGGGGGLLQAVAFKSLSTPNFNQQGTNFSAASVSSLGVQPPSYVQPGTLLVLAVEWSPGATTQPTVTDTMGHTWTPLYATPQTTPTNEFYANIFYTIANGVAYQPTVTATFASASTFVRLWLGNWLGVSVFDQKSSVSTTGAGAVNFSGTVSTSNPNELAVALMIAGGGINGSAPAAGPFGVIQIVNNETLDGYIALNPGSYTDTWLSNGQDTLAILASFRGVPTGAPSDRIAITSALAPSVAVAAADSAGGGSTAIVSALSEALATSALTQEKVLTTSAESSALVVGTANVESAVLASALSPSLSVSASASRADGTTAALAPSLSVTAAVTESKGVAASLAPALAVAAAIGSAQSFPVTSALAPSLAVTAADSSAAGGALSGALTGSLALGATSREQTALSAALTPALAVGSLATKGLLLGSSAVVGQLSVATTNAAGQPLTSAVGSVLTAATSLSTLSALVTLTIHSQSTEALSAYLVAIQTNVDPAGHMDVEVFFPISVTAESDGALSATAALGFAQFSGAAVSGNLAVSGTLGKSQIIVPPGHAYLVLTAWEGYGITLSAGARAVVSVQPGATAKVTLEAG